MGLNSAYTGPVGQGTPILRWTQAEIQPAISNQNSPWVIIPVNLLPSWGQTGSVYQAGQVLAQVTAASVTPVQTISVSGTTGEVFGLILPNALVPNIPYNIPLSTTSTNLQAILQSYYGAGNVLVTGTAGTTYTITWAGAMLYGPQELIQIYGATCTATIDNTTVGVLNGAYTAYNGTQVANPTTAPTLTPTGASGTIGAGTFEVIFTKVTAAGESLPSDPQTVTLTSAQSIQVTSITGLENSVTYLNFYVDGEFFYQKAVTSNASGTVTISAPPATPGIPAPRKNSAGFVYDDGTQIPTGVLQQPCYIDNFGNVTLGTASGAAPLPVNNQALPMIVQGYLRTEQLTGMDANALSVLGRQITGNLTTGMILIGA